jgi:hypothetical protein
MMESKLVRWLWSMSDVDEEDARVVERKVTGKVKKSLSAKLLGFGGLGSDERAALSSPGLSQHGSPKIK